MFHEDDARAVICINQVKSETSSRPLTRYFIERKCDEHVTYVSRDFSQAGFSDTEA